MKIRQIKEKIQIVMDRFKSEEKLEAEKQAYKAELEASVERWKKNGSTAYVDAAIQAQRSQMEMIANIFKGK